VTVGCLSETNTIGPDFGRRREVAHGDLANVSPC
jgi:hypothetical protein